MLSSPLVCCEVLAVSPQGVHVAHHTANSQTCAGTRSCHCRHVIVLRVVTNGHHLSLPWQHKRVCWVTDVDSKTQVRSLLYVYAVFKLHDPTPVCPPTAGMHFLPGLVLTRMTGYLMARHVMKAVCGT